MLGDMRIDRGHRRGAGTSTLPLMSLIFDFESNFVHATR